MEITPRQLEIIEATGKILTKSGTSGLTIKNLAKEMNFSESAIYRHFASKEILYLPRWIIWQKHKMGINKSISNYKSRGEIQGYVRGTV